MSSQRVSGTAVQRTIAVLGSAVFFVVAPFTLAGLVPWSITGWQLRPPFLGLELTRGIGAIMILAGVPGLVDAFGRFALQGLGTPAPIAPTPNLVVTGLYRYVRKSNIRRGRCHHPGSSGADGRLAPHRLRRAALARLPRLRRGVRRTHARADVWERVRGVPRRRPALDTADDPMAVGMINGTSAFCRERMVNTDADKAARFFPRGTILKDLLTGQSPPAALCYPHCAGPVPASAGNSEDLLVSVRLGS